MLDNHQYNLMKQLVQESKSLARISNEYKKDAGDCADCLGFWDKMQKDKEEHIADLEKLIKTHIQ